MEMSLMLMRLTCWLAPSHAHHFSFHRIQTQSAGGHPVIYRTDTDCESLCGHSYVTSGDANVYRTVICILV